jgi:hypothetical protein
VPNKKFPRPGNHGKGEGGGGQEIPVIGLFQRNHILDSRQLIITDARDLEKLFNGSELSMLLTVGYDPVRCFGTDA